MLLKERATGIPDKDIFPVLAVDHTLITIHKVRCCGFCCIINILANNKVFIGRACFDFQRGCICILVAIGVHILELVHQTVNVRICHINLVQQHRCTIIIARIDRFNFNRRDELITVIGRINCKGEISSIDFTWHKLLLSRNFRAVCQSDNIIQTMLAIIAVAA